MANFDITRELLNKRKHYAGVRMQQGRALLDADWNEDALLRAEDLRLTLLDLAGAQGSTNMGFTITNVVVPPVKQSGDQDPYDFSIAPGSYYVGGLRVELGPEAETLLDQRDWVSRPLFTSGPKRPRVDELLPLPVEELSSAAIRDSGVDVLALPPKLRYDLVYLEVWEQAVTAVEDSELRERALGGPDSGVRIRRMRRIHVEQDVASDKPGEAFSEFVATFESGGYGSLDSASNEFVSSAKLTVLPVSELGEQPCGPQPPSGYIGHEDQAIRVQITLGSKITWGFNDAAPLYRVKVGANRKRITFLNQPRDAKLQPKAGQIVEIIPWSAKLPNNEKTAELWGGLFCVAESYDPGTHELLLTAPASDAAANWMDEAREHWSERDGDDGGYFYLRLWDRGSDLTSPPEIDLADGPATLGNTGLQVRLSGLGLPGDHWVIAARRATPDTVVPWQLLDNEPPMGPRRFYAPLALVRWEAPQHVYLPNQNVDPNQPDTHYAALPDLSHVVWGPPIATIINGRHPLTPLCIGGCTTVTVGAGAAGEGMVDTLQEALDLLPPSGGKILLLPGTHQIEIELIGVEDVTICGCGPLTKVVRVNNPGEGTKPTDQGAPIFRLVDCQNITLRDFFIEATNAVGVKLEGSADMCRSICIEDMRFNQKGSVSGAPPSGFALPQPAVLALGGEDLTVRRCRVDVDNVLSYVGALVLGGERLRIHDNWVQTWTLTATTVADAMGGIHILSQSVDVEIAHNFIQGGWGHGIALGHALLWDEAPMSPETITMSDIWAAGATGLGDPLTYRFNYEPITNAPIGTPTAPEKWTPAGNLVDVRIIDNRVTAMGLCGISTGVMRFDHVDTFNSEAFIVIGRLAITGNHVQGNRRITGFDSDLFAPRTDGCCNMAIGGVVISAAIDATIAENRVFDNGTDTDTPTCGLGFIAMQNLVLRDNFVADNGREYTTTGAANEGLRGAIVVEEITALRGYTYKDTIHPNIIVPQPPLSVGTGKLALQVHKNELTQPTGKALWVRHGFDDIVVTENRFLALGDNVTAGTIPDTELRFIKGIAPPTLALPAGGACVEVVGLSPPADLSWPGTPPTMMMVDPGTSAEPGGRVSFCANNGELRWYRDYGHASAFLISALDAVVVDDNTLKATMGSTYGNPYDGSFVTHVVAGNQESFVITNLYAGAAGTVQIGQNRLIEGEVDALLSGVAGPAIFPAKTADTDVIGAILIVGNVGTHCIVGDVTTPAPDFLNEVIIHNTRIYIDSGTNCGHAIANGSTTPTHHVTITG